MLSTRPVPSRAAQSFFQITELLYATIELCSWPSITLLLNVDQRTRSIARQYIRKRVIFFLSKFIPPTSFSPFFRGLSLGGGSIAGGVVRCIMSVHLPQLYDINPSQMDIILSSLADRNTLGDFFVSHGYNLTRSGLCSRPFAAGCRYNELYTSVTLLLILFMLHYLILLSSSSIVLIQYPSPTLPTCPYFRQCLCQNSPLNATFLPPPGFTVSIRNCFNPIHAFAFDKIYFQASQPIFLSTILDLV